ncbi:MAG: hypothetical protein J1F33_01555 [Clostridiales bacterium]|nr:hypothetical protein [Clostridiales bacterium]
MIIPSVAACLLSTPYWEVSFAAAYQYEHTLPFGEIMSTVFDDYWKYVWPVVFTSALQIAASSLIMSAIDRHFRTAKMSLRSPFKLMNISIVPVLFGVLIMSAVSVVFRFVLYGLVTLVQWISDAASFAPVAPQIIVAVIAVGLFVLHILTIVPMLYWAPMMFVYGYGLRDAAAYSFKMIGGKKVGRGILLPLLICAAVQLLVGYLDTPEAVCKLIGFFIYLFTNMYVTVYVIVSFYHFSELDRRDVVVYMPIVTEPVKPADKPKETGVNDEISEDGGASDPKPDEKGEGKSKKSKPQNKKNSPPETKKSGAKKSAEKPKTGKSKTENNKSGGKAKSSGGKKPKADANAEVKEGGDVV